MHVDLIREELRKLPFQPFRLRLVDGRVLPVPHPDFVAVSNRRVVVIEPDDRGMSILEPLLIVSIEYAGAAQGARHRTATGLDRQEELVATVRTAKAYQRVVLHGVDWHGYRAIGRALADRPGLRLTYDQGILEIMTTSPEHERFKRLIDRLLTAWAEEMGMAMTCLGSMTFQRRRHQRGLEPDQCYWVAHEAQIRNKDRIDFRVDPPPDLVLEIVISRSSLNRMAMYGLMGVPEVWRFRRGTLVFLARQPDGRYADVPQSLSLPPLAPADLLPFLAMRGAADENAIIRQFRAWIHQKFLAGGAAPPVP